MHIQINNLLLGEPNGQSLRKSLQILHRDNTLTLCNMQEKKLKIQIQDVHEEKMKILALVSAKPLESNNDMVFVSLDGLSHTVHLSPRRSG
jgi:hypothetical protein